MTEEPKDPISIGRALAHMMDHAGESCDAAGEKSDKNVERRTVTEDVITIKRIKEHDKEMRGDRGVNLGNGVYGYPTGGEKGGPWVGQPPWVSPGLDQMPNTYPQPAPADAQVSPDHYGRHGIQPIVFMVMNFSHEGFVCFLVGNIIKYVDRAPGKNGLDDYKKARVYTNWLCEYEEFGQITVNGKKYGPGKQ